MKDSIAPRPDEMAAAASWWDAHLAGDAWPFSLQLDGQRVDGPAGGWQVDRTSRELDDHREELTLTARHGDHGLVVRCVAVRYRDFPAVEWTVHLEQHEGVCPLVEEVLGLDARWQYAEGNSFAMRGLNGDTHEQRDLYAPWRLKLPAGQNWSSGQAEPRGISIAPTWGSRLVPTGRSLADGAVAREKEEGRPCSGAFPFFAVEEGKTAANAAWTVERGFLLAVGWPGRWRAEFACVGHRELCVRAGQERTRLRLRLGETIRAPLIAILFHEGDDPVRAQNLWRRWMIAHNLPRLNGALPPPMLEASTCGFLDEMTKADEANQIEYIDRHCTAKLPITHWWMDAGWYPCWVEARKKNCWGKTGTWETDRTRFPRGLRAIADHAHTHEIKTIVWFEPERVAPGTWLHERPQWLLKARNQQVMAPGTQPATWDELWSAAQLLDLGNDEARAWLIDRTSALIVSEGIDVYRQDFNFSPLPYWRDTDAPEREGLTENRYVAGYLVFWDALRERFPGMLLDSCASGGRRNDLETLRRGVALHPTDHRYDDLPVKQAIRHSLFQWMPFFGGPVKPLDRVDPYAFRSTMGLSTCVGFDLRQEHDLDLLRKLMTEWHEVAPLFYGDFYPLTSYSLSDDAWMAWQFHRPEQGDGLVQAFRRPASPHESGSFALSGLDAQAVYELKDYDQPSPVRCRGAELLAGLRVDMPERPQSRTIRYRRVSGG